ncbi:MAG: protein kinase domain-containing protein [Gemmatimonadaceae bacterium]
MTDSDVRARQSAQLRRRVRSAAHRIVSDCEILLSDTAQPEWRLWREAIGEALLAGHQLRAIVDRRFYAPGVVLSPSDIVAMNAELREPQHRVVQAMTRLIGLVPTDVDDELLLDDARAVRDAALRLGSDETEMMPVVVEPDVRASSPGARAAAQPKVAADAQVPLLLVVDDMDAPRQSLIRLLKRLGYEVVDADNGLKGIAIAESRKVDVILSDIEMPECDGFELLRRLKENPDTRDIPVIVVSGLDDTDSIVRCIELGAEDHLAKPFNSLMLQARVRASLERKQLRDHEITYLSRVAKLTVAAEEVESATYRPGSLSLLAASDDPLGRLARVFDRVASAWQSRAAKLEQRVRNLKQTIRKSKSTSSIEPIALLGDEVLGPGYLLAERYEIVDEIGRGGMGVVYRARDRELDEDIAIKVVRAELVNTHPGLIDRLKMETRLARRITHPNVVRSHDLGEWNGLYFLTMEFVQGITVEGLIESHGRLSVASSLAIGTQLAEALVVAHAQQIIHRDIKPANLLVDDDGVLKVTDFGLARPVENYSGLTNHGMVVGTPQYMAPEQIFGNVVDERSDLFAVGVVLYECLTGLPPYDANSPTEIVARMVDGPAVPVNMLVPDVTPAVAGLISQLLHYEPKDRLQSANELVERLREVG